MKAANALKALALSSVVLGCSYDVDINGRKEDPDQAATLDYDGLRQAPGLGWYELSQGWNSELRRAFWFTPQGSALIPYKWFLNLEMPKRNCEGKSDAALNKGNWTYFRDSGHLRSLGFIPASSDPVWNPDGLPIGFAKSSTREDGEFLGPTCAACHTNLMHLKGRKVLVEGAPTLADIQGLNIGLANALCSMDETMVDKNLPDAESRKAAAKAQFKTFAEKVLAGDPKATGAEPFAKLQEELFAKVQEQRGRIMVRNARNYSNLSIYPHYGRGRLDAVGAILNEAAVEIANHEDNIVPANAPVSYPFLWGTSQSDVVQWNGFAPNQFFGFGPLGRNAGEVVGVYGYLDAFPEKVVEAQKLELLRKLKDLNFLPPGTPDVSKIDGPSDRSLTTTLTVDDLRKFAPKEVVEDVNRQSPFHPLLTTSGSAQFGGIDSSILLKNLGSIEHWVGKLLSPKWPADVLGKIDPEKSGRGREIYENACASCHQIVERRDQHKAYFAKMVRIPEVGTDPAMAENFLLERHPSTGKPWKTGFFKDTKIGFPWEGRFGENFTVRGEALTAIVFDVILGKLLPDGISGAIRSRSVSEENPATSAGGDRLYRYKARPLNGIWATAPYLHNGSVPNLAQLLMPEAERDKIFCVGSREFDPDVVGFVSKIGPDGKCIDVEDYAMPLDTSYFGSSNRGHHYGVELDKDKDKNRAMKADLLEFLKTL